ncbi:TonB-dependent receptor [Vibrio tapetis subsp. quintayensis]|uniref:TonB-dependent receptor n=1 Tax=Vibrio tapetis TaxID=52443 RepID=UPI0025B2CBA1|nr:TonB-dependent receptor [Vibrio tapetis]MDN3681210.1 TonB-dependent receptor [Vibrio tapetis subsp. quintayensis]
MYSCSHHKLLLVLLSAQLGVASAFISTSVQANEASEFNIPAGTLDTVLNEFAIKAGIEFHLNSALSNDLYSPGINGQYNVDDALSLLLSNTGLRALLQPDGAYRVASEQAGMTLAPIQVRTSLDDGTHRDEEGEYEIYDNDVSSTYLSKEEIERFKGTSAADLFTGMANTHSGEARNGGGSIDPNIRGVQGPGRVPVVIDGTEQGISVYNGYRGASNRNYIDPNLIGGMKVHKGAQINSDINTSVGGAVEVTTLTPQDIVPEGETFGLEFVAESSSNSIEPNVARLHTGKNWQDVPAYAELGGVPLYDDPELRFQTRSDKNDNPVNGEDVAYRLAISGISPKFEWLGAYAYRNRGNYYSGTKDSGFYAQPYKTGDRNGVAGRIPYLQPEHVALNHLPGHEVPNTSSEMESFLLKTTFNMTDFHKLQFSARFTESTHGEILASRSDYRNQDGLPQWPLANVKMQAYSLKFRANPANPYLDLSTNLWTTLTDSRTNTGYGFPNFTHQKSDTPNKIINTATVNREESRVGFNFKNAMTLTEELDLSLSGNYQQHKLAPKEGLQYMIDLYEGPVRAGEREEYNGAITMEWRPLESVIFNAGVRYSQYQSEDHYIKNRLDAGDTKSLETLQRDGYTLRYQTIETFAAEEIAQNVANAEQGVRATFTKDNIAKNINRYQNLMVMFPDRKDEFQQQIQQHQSELANFDNLLASKVETKVTAAQNETTYTVDHQADWMFNAKNELKLAGNACANAMKQANYVSGSCKASSKSQSRETNTRYKNSGSGWVPSLSTTWLIDDSSRTYARYAETLRFPSLFESTSGFSGNPSFSAPLEPERAKLFEVAYIRYFDTASAKLTYFDQVIEDVMDRDRDSFSFANLDSQRTSGIELQGMFDNDAYFGDASVAYNFRNEVCDENSAARGQILDISNGTDSSDETCVRGGYTQTSYLAAHAAPEYSASIMLGARFFNQDLETGLRGNYVSGSHKDEVIKRTNVTTYDAYIKYIFNKQFEAELIGTNLTDLYYLETGSVSGMPAPGRTVSLKLHGRF